MAQGRTGITRGFAHYPEDGTNIFDLLELMIVVALGMILHDFHSTWIMRHYLGRCMLFGIIFISAFIMPIACRLI